MESSDAAALAIIAGGRMGRLVTLGKTRMLVVRASRSAMSAYVSKKRRW
jgi:hypothetical protein